MVGRDAGCWMLDAGFSEKKPVFKIDEEYFFGCTGDGCI
jgi:hypothetical protein